MIPSPLGPPGVFPWDRTETGLPPRSLGDSAYDTAWVASLRDPADRASPRFPAAFEWILRNQHKDGSWGGALPYQHDRLLATLAALRCLVRFSQQERVTAAIHRAQHYVWRHAHELRAEPIELVGFELIVPTLLRDVMEANVQLPHYLNAYEVERAHKLALIPDSLIYSPGVTVVHSLEFLGASGDVSRLLQTVNSIGAVGNSPAATAYLLDKVESPAALQYLRTCLETGHGEVATVTYPCENFDALWTAYHGLLGDIEQPAALLPAAFCAKLRQLLADGSGVSFSDTFPIADADDTAVAIAILRAGGESVSAAALIQFERSGHYTSYQFERNPSIGVNVHVLDALSWLPHDPVREIKIQKLIQFVDDKRTHRMYWFDKWHISPYYATAHAIVALGHLKEPHRRAAVELCRPALDWIRATQREDGSWGYYATATCEESAFAALALAHAGTLQHDEDAERIHRGARYVKASFNEAPGGVLPPLWVDKCLYYPSRIVEALISSVLKLSARMGRVS